MKRLLLISFLFLVSLISRAQTYDAIVESTDSLIIGNILNYQGQTINLDEVTYHEFSSDSINWHKVKGVNDIWVRFSNDVKNTWFTLPTEFVVNITGNEPAFDGWDKNEADDFSGDYNDLINQPNIHPAATLTTDDIAVFSLNEITQAFTFNKAGLNLNTYVPYTGAAGNVNLGEYDLSASAITSSEGIRYSGTDYRAFYIGNSLTDLSTAIGSSSGYAIFYSSEVNNVNGWSWTGLNSSGVGTSDRMTLSHDGHLNTNEYYEDGSPLLLDAHKSGSLGTAGQLYVGNGTTSTPVWTSPSSINLSSFNNDLNISGGDVSKVGTPVNDQVAIWTGDGTIEGDPDLTFDGTSLTVTRFVYSAFTAWSDIGNRSGNLTVFAYSAMNYELTLVGDFTLYVGSTDDGHTGRLLVHQDATGGHSFTLSASPGTPVLVGNVSQPDQSPLSTSHIVWWKYDGNLYYTYVYPQPIGGGGGGAPETASYLVATADATLTNEIVVGTTPGGDLGGTWASPQVDNDSHSHGSTTISGLEVGDLGGVSGTPSSSTFLRGDNTWATIAGGGDVIKVGTPVDNQVAIWTGNGTVEGDPDMTFNGSVLTVTTGISTGAIGNEEGFTRIDFGTGASGYSSFTDPFIAYTSSSDPSGINGMIYYNNSTHTFKGYENGGWIDLGAGAGSSGVTSVALAAPTGFSVSGSPVTSTGTLTLSFASGYSLPTNTLQSNWTDAYNNKVVSAGVAGTTSKTLTLNQQDGGSVQAGFTDLNTTNLGKSTSNQYTSITSDTGTNTQLYWTGTQAQYDALGSYDSSTIYFIED